MLIGDLKENRKNLPSNIIEIGRLSKIEELVKWYTAADVYVNASVEETMGLTTVEAMACGTPVVVMNATANPELVNERCGCVVEVGNIEQLLNAIYSLKKDENTVRGCIARAADYEKKKQYQKYIQLYKDILCKLEN